MKPEQAFRHCRKQGRIKELEKIILTDTKCAYKYSLHIIKDRWIEAEDIISTDSRYIYLYSLHVIKGKLPEHMHNAMILHFVANPNDRYVKLYWDKISTPIGKFHS